MNTVACFAGSANEAAEFVNLQRTTVRCICNVRLMDGSTLPTRITRQSSSGGQKVMQYVLGGNIDAPVSSLPSSVLL